MQPLGSVELDLPEPPEKAALPPPLVVDPSSRFGPKEEIAHIFRAPEKRPPRNLSYAFLALVLLPFVGFLVGVGLSLNHACFSFLNKLNVMNGSAFLHLKKGKST